MKNIFIGGVAKSGISRQAIIREIRLYEYRTK